MNRRSKGKLTLRLVNRSKPAGKLSKPQSKALQAKDDKVPSGLTLEIQPNLKGKHRLVIARRDGKEIHRDEINTNAEASRNSFIKKLSQLLSLTDNEEQAIANDLIKQADKNDALLLAAQNNDRTSDSRLTQKDLLALVADAELIRTPSGEVYITLCLGEYSQTISVDSRNFSRWLSKQCYDKYGRVPAEALIADTQTIVSMEAEHRGVNRDLSIRVAAAAGRIYLDSGRPDGKVHRVTAKGTSLVIPRRVRFIRSKAFQSLPDPQPKGAMTSFFELLNLRDETSKILLAGTLVGMLNASIPQPILLIYGPQGSAKSTATRLIKLLLDPARPLIRGQPREERELIIAARRNWILGFDNLSSCPVWLSDSLCRLSSGLGFASRQSEWLPSLPPLRNLPWHELPP